MILSVLDELVGMEDPEQTGRATTAAVGGDVDALRSLAEQCGSKVLAASADGSTPAHAAAAQPSTVAFGATSHSAPTGSASAVMFSEY